MVGNKFSGDNEYLLARMPSSSTSTPLEKWSRQLVHIPLLLGFLNLLAWQFGSEQIYFPLSRGLLLNPMTAVGLILAALAVLGLRSEQRYGHLLGWLCAFLAVAVATLKIFGLLHIVSWPIDWLLYSERLQQPAYERIRMAPNTCLNLILHGCALWTSRESFRRRWPRLSLIPLVCLSIEGLTGLMAFLNFVFDVQSASTISRYLPMALPSSISFMCLSLTQLLSDKKIGFVKILLGVGTTSLTARRLALGAILVPIVIAWLTLRGQSLGLFDSGLSIAIFCVLLNVCFLLLIVWTSTTLHQYDQQKAEHEREIELLTNAHFEGVVVIVGGVVKHANLQFCRMVGYEQDEVVGAPITTFVAPQSLQQTASRIDSGSEDSYRSWALRKDGSHFEMEVVPRVVNWQGQRARVSVVRDITKQRAVEKLKDEFVSIVSHELRTPVTSIHGSLGLLAGHAAGDLPPAAQNLVELGLRNSQRLILLINDILDIQKIEAGMVTFAYQQVDLSSLVAAAVETNAAYASSFKVKLEFKEDEAANLLVNADPDRLTQVLTNLLSNAIKFSPPEGVVQVRTSRRGQFSRVEVQDNGPGIPLDFQEKIFQKFAQADSSSTRQQGGTGLGLSISKAIVEKLNGRIGFSTELGVGTVFYFEMPLESSHPNVQ